MGSLFSIVAVGVVLAVTNAGDLLAAPSNARISIDKCKNGGPTKGCQVVGAPEIDTAGGLIPIVLIGGALLLAAESRRRIR